MASLAGSFLVARPALTDPNFRQSVVLLLQHDEDGAFGLVVNRPARGGKLPLPVFLGGPCDSEGLFLLHGYEDWTDDDDDEEDSGSQVVAPGIFLGDHTCLTRVNEVVGDATVRCRLFKAYAGWGPGQLEGEIAQGAWAVTRANGELLFDTPAADLWALLLPPAIPEPSVN